MSEGGCTNVKRRPHQLLINSRDPLHQISMDNSTAWRRILWRNYSHRPETPRNEQTLIASSQEGRAPIIFSTYTKVLFPGNQKEYKSQTRKRQEDYEALFFTGATLNGFSEIFRDAPLFAGKGPLFRKSFSAKRLTRGKSMFLSIGFCIKAVGA